MKTLIEGKPLHEQSAIPFPTDIATDAEHSYQYAQYVLNTSFPMGEDAILQSQHIHGYIAALGITGKELAELILRYPNI